MATQSKNRNYWIGICIAYVVILYTTLPLGRPLINIMHDHLDRSQQILLIYYLFGLVGLAIVGYIIANAKSYSLIAIVSLVVLCRLYFLEFTTLVKYPEERLHFIEYGILVLLLYRAYAYKLTGIWPYILTAITGCLIGLGDECVQFCTVYLPKIFDFLKLEVSNPKMFRRYFNWSDVHLNCLGVFYGLVLLITVLQNRRK